MAKATTKILIVEDEPFLMKILVDKLSLEKFPTLSGANGEEGLKLALENHPGVILLDILMPRMNGIEMLTELRKDAWGKGVPVIMLTNLNDPDHIAQAKALGAKDFIVKADWKLSELVVKIKKYLDGK